MPEPSLAARFKNITAGFDQSNFVSAPVQQLDSISQELLRSEDIRKQFGGNIAIWPDLRRLWRGLTRAHLSFWDADDSDGEESEGERLKQQGLRASCISVAKFTRNLVAGVPNNQNRAYESEPDIRRLLHYYTSWSATENKDSIIVARFLTQCLSNLVTGNESCLTKVWETYLKQPEDQLILIRLLASPDERTLLTTLVFVFNCLHGSGQRVELLSQTKNGNKICISLLDDMVKLHDAGEGTTGAEAFDVGYRIFSLIVEHRCIPKLWENFSTDEIVNPYKTTLLKLLDSYLQSLSIESLVVRSEVVELHWNLTPILASIFLTLSNYGRQSLYRSVGSSNFTAGSPTTQLHTSPRSSKSGGLPANSSTASPLPVEANLTSPTIGQSPEVSIPFELDVLLPKVCEAIVIVTQCITTISLQSEDHRESYLHSIPGKSHLDRYIPKDYYNLTTLDGEGFAEHIIDLLRLLDLFLPRINFGRPVPTQQTHPTLFAAKQPTIPTPDADGFSYLKRDLIRLLGVLCHRNKSVQDRIRLSQGIPIVMNLCVIDERNPYLREHAIFALRNLLEGNAENQAFVGATKPLNISGPVSLLS